MMRESRDARRYNTLVTLTYAETIVDDYGHRSYDEPMNIADVYASVERMSASKTLMTFQQADVIGLDIELREPNVAFNGLRYDGHDVHFSEPEPRERGRILRISGWYQVDR
jgi:hypothetical protein